MRALLLRLNRHFLGRLATAAAMTVLTFEAYWSLNEVMSPRFDLLLPLDRAIPFLPWTVPLYLSFYGLVLAAAWVCEPEEFLRVMAALLFANLLCYSGFVLLPSHYPRPDLATLGGTAWHGTFAAMWGSDRPGNTFPSIHVAITSLLGLRLRLRRSGALWLTWATLICLSTLTVKQHFVVDVVGGVAVALLSHAMAFRAPAREPLPEAHA